MFGVTSLILGTMKIEGAMRNQLSRRLGNGIIRHEKMKKETIENTEHSRIYKLFQIGEIIRDSGACKYCIRRWVGETRKGKLRTRC